MAFVQRERRVHERERRPYKIPKVPTYDFTLSVPIFSKMARQPREKSNTTDVCNSVLPSKESATSIGKRYYRHGTKLHGQPWAKLVIPSQKIQQRDITSWHSSMSYKFKFLHGMSHVGSIPFSPPLSTGIVLLRRIPPGLCPCLQLLPPISILLYCLL